MRQTIILLFLIVTALTAGKAPFSIEALYKIKNVGDPQISPDGLKIAFVVTAYQLADGASNSEIWLMDANSKQQRQMTNNPAADFHPRWSKDGKSLLFISTRNEGAQAWLMPANGGEPRQLTHFYSGVSDAEWIPGKQQIVFSSDVFPECGADNGCNKEILEDMQNGPLQAHMADHLLYRHWTSYKDGRHTHLIFYDITTNAYRDLTPDDYDFPAFGGTFAVSPDGRWICVESKHDDFAAESTNNDLFLIRLSDLATTNLTQANEAFDGQPAFSPDGRYIAYQQQKIAGYEADLKRLAVYDLKTKQSRTLTENFDHWTEQYHWSPDSRFIYFRAHEKGHFPFYRYDLKRGKIQRIADVKTPDAFDLSADGRWLAASRRTIEHPSEIVRVQINNGQTRRLTFFNKALEDSVDIRPAEELWIASPKTGKKIHTFVIKPHDFDPAKKYPLILNVHGGPQYQWYNGFRGDWQVYPGYGYIVAFPNPHGSTGYGQDFTAEISGDWAGKVYQDVMAVADSLSKLAYVDDRRMGAMGWSYGGYMMMWLEGHSKRFKAIVSMMGVYDLTAMYGATEELWFPNWDLKGAPWENPKLYRELSPNNYVKNFSTPCLVITGEKDYRVPYTQSLEFFTGLQKMRVPSRLIVFKNDGHWPNYVKSMPFYYNAHLDWFHKYLGGGAAPYDMTKMLRNKALKK